MVKKYYVDRNSVFAKSLILPFYEGDNVGFNVEGLDYQLRKELFNPKSLKVKGNDIDPSSVTTYCYAVYLDEQLHLKNLIIYSQNKKLYYSFRHTNQGDFKLRYQNNYVSSDPKVLEIDYEKSLKKKGVNHFNGLGDFKLIRDINYFDNLYNDHINPRINKKSDISQLVFTANNKFTVDFINLTNCNVITITNKSHLGNKVLSLDAMSKLKNNRKDCLFVNFQTGSIDFFIYTYRPITTNHYLLFKGLGDNKFEFIAESICFNQLLLREETKNLYFKKGSDFASNALSKMNYDVFLERYLEFSKDEEIDEEFNIEWELLELLKQESKKKSVSIDTKVEAILKGFGCFIDNNVIYFKDYETIPLGAFGDQHIKIKQNRSLTDLSLTNQISLKDLTRIEKSLTDLLQNKPSSRLLALDKLIDNIVKESFNQNDEEQCLLVEEIEDSLKTLWPNDKKYPVSFYKDILEKYNNWKSGVNKVEISKVTKKAPKKKEVPDDVNVIITLHAALRIDERIGKLSEEEKLQLAKEAYYFGKTSVHFYEVDNKMFSFLQYQQNKYLGKTLRLHEGVIYIFSMKPPHSLITCYPINDSFDRYVAHMR